MYIIHNTNTNVVGWQTINSSSSHTPHRLTIDLSISEPFTQDSEFNYYEERNLDVLLKAIEQYKETMFELANTDEEMFSDQHEHAGVVVYNTLAQVAINIRNFAVAILGEPNLRIGVSVSSDFNTVSVD